MNTIRRRSDESSVTIPFERTFRNLDLNRPATGTTEELEFNFCGCGWPQHMLIPKGTSEGLPCQLFVMVSDYERDHVSVYCHQSSKMFTKLISISIFNLFYRIDLTKQVEQKLVGSCSDAASYCGVRDRLYPDRRPMGYPFDRLPRQGVDSLSNFLTPNMSIVDVVIRHNNRTVTKGQ